MRVTSTATPSSPARPRLLANVVAAAMSVVGSLVAWRFTCDDAAITFAFSRSWGDGDRLGTLVAGDPIVSGFSNPVWTVVLGLAHRVGLPIVGTSKVLGTLAAAVTAWLIVAVVERLTSHRIGPAVAALVGCSATVATWAVSGLENASVALAAVATLHRLIVEEQDDHRGVRALGSAATAAILVVSRPDAFVYLPFAAVAVARSVRVRGATWPGVARSVAAWSVLPVAALGAWSAFSLARFGSVLPNTFHAKVGLSATDRVLHPVDALRLPVAQLGSFLLVTGAALLLPLAAYGLFRRRPGAATTLGLFLTASAALPLAEADWMTDFRFYTVLAPLLVAAAALGVDRLAGRIGAAPTTAEPSVASGRRVTPDLARVGAALVVLWAVTNVAVLGVRAAEGFDGQVTEAEVTREATIETDAAAAHGITDPVVLAGDAGGRLFDGHQRLVDVAGLTDPQVGRLGTDRAGRFEYGVIERRPDLIHAGIDGWYWGFDDDALTRAGYLPLLDVAGRRFVRRDLVERTIPTGGDAALDAVVAVPAAAGGPATLRVWLGDPSGATDGAVPDSLALRVTSDGAPTVTVPVGAGVAQPDAWPVDAQVLHVVRLHLPGASGSATVRVDLVADGRVLRPVGTARIEVGADAVTAAAERLTSTPPASAIDAVARLGALADLRTATADGAAVDDLTASFVARARPVVRGQIERLVAAPRLDRRALDEVTETIQTVRGRRDADAADRGLAESLRADAAERGAEDRYRLLVTAATLNPGSARLQADLLEARAARPSRSTPDR